MPRRERLLTFFYYSQVFAENANPAPALMREWLPRLAHGLPFFRREIDVLTGKLTAETRRHSFGHLAVPEPRLRG
jgi:hypothetical protein